MPTLTPRSGARAAARSRRRCRRARARAADCRRTHRRATLVEALAHAWSSPPPRRRRHAGGRARGPSAPARAHRDRARRRSPRPALEPKRDAMPSGQPCVERELSTTIAVSRSSPSGRRARSASWFEPSSSSASPTRQKTRGQLTRARSASARPTAIGKPWPSEPLAISTPGRAARSGWRPRGESKAPKPRQRSPGRSPWPRAPRSRPSVRGPSRAGSGRARGRPRSDGSIRKTRS